MSDANETSVPDRAELPSEVPNEALSVTSCGPDDRGRQADLFNRCFKKKVTAEDLVWRYDRSPHGRSSSFMTTTPGGMGVTGYACSPRRVVPDGNEAFAAPVGETGDVMTDPAWRKRGLFSALDRACMEETKQLGWPVVFGLPNRRSAHIFLALGWAQVGTVRPWTHLLKSDNAARELRRREGRLAGLSTPLGARRSRVARERLLELAGSHRAEDADRFPEEIEHVSRAVEPRFAWMTRRDATWLNWRFVDSPAGLHRFALIRNGAGKLVGHVIVQVPRPGEPLGYLVDVLGIDDAAVAAAMSAGLAQLEAAGASAVQATAIDGSWWNERLVDAGFLAPKPENHLIVILWTNDPDHPLARAGRDAASWYLTDGDRDDETMG